MRGDMMKTYKIISGLEDVNSSQFFARSSMDNLRGHSMKLYMKHFRKVIRKEFFLRGMEWAARKSCKAKTLNSFKNLLDKY